MKTIRYKGRTLVQVPKDITKEELDRLIKSGAQFYVRKEEDSPIN